MRLSNKIGYLVIDGCLVYCCPILLFSTTSFKYLRFTSSLNCHQPACILAKSTRYIVLPKSILNTTRKSRGTQYLLHKKESLRHYGQNLHFSHMCSLYQFCCRGLRATIHILQSQWRPFNFSVPTANPLLHADCSVTQLRLHLQPKHRICGTPIVTIITIENGSF